MIEPQWGSSVAAMPWPPALLKAYIAEAKSRGIAVVADEIICGLGRHGAEPVEGGTGCFLSECWDLQPDVVTFSKAIGGGAGHLLSGAVLLHSAEKLEMKSKTALQSHTVRASNDVDFKAGSSFCNPYNCCLLVSVDVSVYALPCDFPSVRRLVNARASKWRGAS